MLPFYVLGMAPLKICQDAPLCPAEVGIPTSYLRRTQF